MILKKQMNAELSLSLAKIQETLKIKNTRAIRLLNFDEMPRICGGKR
jgi:hypothetical protein